MPRYEITDTAHRIFIEMPDGKTVEIRPHDKVAREPVIILPKDREGGEFTSHQAVKLPEIGLTPSGATIHLIGLDEKIDEIAIDYSKKGEGEPQTLITIRK